MKKLFCVFVVLFGLAFSNEMDDHQAEDGGYSGPVYELSELKDSKFCTLTVRDRLACKFLEFANLARDSQIRMEDYYRKAEEAKEAGKTYEEIKLRGSELKAFESFVDNALKACEIWDDMTYRGKQFLINHVVHTQDGETSRVVKDEDEVLDACGRALNEEQERLQKAIKEYEEEIKAKK